VWDGRNQGAGPGVVLVLAHCRGRGFKGLAGGGTLVVSQGSTCRHYKKQKPSDSHRFRTITKKGAALMLTQRIQKPFLREKFHQGGETGTLAFKQRGKSNEEKIPVQEIDRKKKKQKEVNERDSKADSNRKWRK